MGKFVFFSLAISIARMIVLGEARFFGDYDSIGSSGLHYQTMSHGGNYAPHRSDLFGGGVGSSGNSDAPLQISRIGGFGCSHRLFRSRASGDGNGGGTSGNGRRGRGGKDGKRGESKKSTKSSAAKEKDEPSTDEPSTGIDSSESKVVQFNDLKKLKKEEDVQFNERFKNAHGMSVQEFQGLMAELEAGRKKKQIKDRGITVVELEKEHKSKLRNPHGISEHEFRDVLAEHENGHKTKQGKDLNVKKSAEHNKGKKSNEGTKKTDEIDELKND